MNSAIFDLNLTFSVEDHLKCQLAVATMLVISVQGFLVKKKWENCDLLKLYIYTWLCIIVYYLHNR